MKQKAHYYLWRRRVDHPAAVKEAVDAQGGAPSKGLATVLTGVRFFSSVKDQVLLQVPLQAIGLLTVRTGKWALTAMTHLEMNPVLLEIIRENHYLLIRGYKHFYRM